MSLLSKLFVILVFVIALIKLGIDVTLFAQKVDWKDKFIKEVNYHYATQQIKNAEIAARDMEVENQRAFMAILADRINTLDTENSGKAARINDLQRQLDSANTLATKYEADMQVFVRQLEVQLAQIQELTTKVDEHRAKLAKSLNEKSLASAERLAWLSRPAYSSLAAVWAQSEADAHRLVSLGAKVAGVYGNLKFDAAPDARQLAHAQAVGQPDVDVQGQGGSLEGGDRSPVQRHAVLDDLCIELLAELQHLGPSAVGAGCAR